VTRIAVPDTLELLMVAPVMVILPITMLFLLYLASGGVA
jgi:hypothetical protein